MTRLLGSDLDGTLLATRAQREGLNLIFVTGRPARWMRDISEMTGFQGQALCANGAVMLDLPSQEIMWADILDGEIGLEAVRRLREIDPNIALGVELARPEKDFMIDQNYVPRWETLEPPIRANVEEMFATGVVTKLLARPSQQLTIGPDEFLSACDAALEGIVDSTHSDLTDVLVEISALGVNKGSGLAKHAAALGISQDQVAAVGDMPNDIPMIRWAGRGAAVANAHDWVKQAADEHLPSNDDHGVATFIDRILSGN